MVINSNNGDPAGFPTLETTACDSRGILKLNQNLIINKSDINDLYRMDKGAPFATGLYAQVRRCKSLRPSSSQKSSQSYYAAKFSPRKRPGHPQNEDCVESLHEIALLCQLKSPYIISFKDAFILDDFIVTIMEFAPGGDLQSVIDADLVLLEKDASRYVYQLLEALKYLHSRHIAHLDIKPQNLLLMGEFPSCDIKLCDFEISRVIRPGMEIREILGTPDYVAPEILLYEPLSTFCDMWSVGILTYVLLTGFSPFGGDTDQETFRNIINEPIDFPEELFEDVSPAAIDFIEKLAVKNGRTRPSALEMEMHEWVRSYVDPSIIASISVPTPAPVVPKEVTPAQPEGIISATYGGCGPKKRSPRKASAMSNCSTASANPAGRRHTARAILRACKSAYDLNKMGGKTKSREALIEKMRIATGESSGGPWKLRKNLSKSREQLWESKIQLSKSCERINIFPGSTRWASVANFPSLDMNTMKSASQESVISVMSTCTNVGNTQQQVDMSDWQQQAQEETFPYSVSMPSTPPVPNFDLSHNNGYHESSPPIINNFTGLQGKPNQSGEFSGYPSLQSSNVAGGDAVQFMSVSQAAANAAAIEESQKSVAELIMTFGGRVSKKLDLKNKFEPIMEVDGSEEQPMSLGDCSDNNSTSGVSSIIPTSNNGSNTPNGKQVEGSLITNTNNKSNGNSLSAKNKMDTGQEPSSGNNSRRNSKTAQQITDEMKSSERRHNNRDHGGAMSTRRGSMSPPKNPDGTTLKGILKKPKPQPQLHQEQSSAPHHHHPRAPSEFPNTSSARRGSIPSNCFRLYEQHTISSSAKVPKKSILKNSNRSTATVSPARTGSVHGSTTNPSSHGTSGRSGTSTERSTSRSPENQNNNNNPTTTTTTATTKTTSGPPSKDEILKDEKNENTIAQPASTPGGNFPSNNNSSNNATVQHRHSRPTSVLITSNADNKLDVELRAEPRRRPRPVSTDCSTYVISPEKEKQFEKEIKAEMNKSRQQAKKRNEQNNLESNKSSHQSNINNNNIEKNNMNNDNDNVQQTEINIPTGDGLEPAAVAIKVFPPDPIIIPKSSVLLLTSAKTPDSPGAEDIVSQVAVAAEFKEYAKRNSTSSTTSSTSTTSTTVVSNNNNNNKQMKTSPEGMKSQWGVVCTGSVERAKERFESVRSKLRRGSVPDF